MKLHCTLAMLISTTLLCICTMIDIASGEKTGTMLLLRQNSRKAVFDSSQANTSSRCYFQKANELMTWPDHNLHATRILGCNLASILSEEEQVQVQTMYSGTDIDPSRTRIWTGAMKTEKVSTGSQQQIGDWQWSDGSPFTYANWNTGEPSNQTEETRGHLIFPHYPKSTGMKWNNRSPNETQAALYKCCDD